MTILDKLNIEHHESGEDEDGVMRETVIGIPVVGIQFVAVEKKHGSFSIFVRREGDTLPRYQIHPEEKKMDYSEEVRAEYE